MLSIPRTISRNVSAANEANASPFKKMGHRSVTSASAHLDLCASKEAIRIDVDRHTNGRGRPHPRPPRREKTLEIHGDGPL